MAVMIPDSYSPDIKSNAEKHIFEWFKKAPGTDDWIVLHSLGIALHQKVIHGEVDFLVLAPSLGIFALEVKGGRVQRKMGKWRFINRYGEYTEKIRGPFDQAWEGIYSIQSSIENRLDQSHQKLKNIVFGIGVMFPDIEYESAGIDEEPWQVFDCKDGINVRGFIERLAAGSRQNMERLGYTVSEDNEPTATEVKYLADILKGDFLLDVPLRIKQKYAEKEFITLTREQALCIEQLGENQRVLIRGSAGTGKTMLAIEAVRKAVDEGEKVAVFCYNRLLGEWLKKCFSDMPLDKRPMFAGTFHSFLNRLLIAHGIVTDRIESVSDIEYYNNILPSLVIKHCSESPVQYDRIIIDEAQDLLRDNYLNILDFSLRGGLERGNWLMLGDFSRQAIYSDHSAELEYLNMIQERAFYSMFRLNKNCRNTKKICIDIENILGIPENAAFDDHLESPSVNHIVYRDMEEQKTKLIKIIRDLMDESIKANDIVILSPRKRADSVVGELHGLKVLDYSMNEAGKIRFSTIQAFKGLESSVVILADIESYQNENLIYVGLSRARFSLYILESEAAAEERNQLFTTRRLSHGR